MLPRGSGLAQNECPTNFSLSFDFDKSLSFDLDKSLSFDFDKLKLVGQRLSYKKLVGQN
jgi:hypothetical protein